MMPTMLEKPKYNIQLCHVEFIPKELDCYMLYVSERFKVAVHLCPCGCGTKIVTPLGLGEWTFSEHSGKATLDPSIGNWQIPCRSHYWIVDGDIHWSYPWTDKQIKEGWKRDQQKREQVYKKKEKSQKKSLWGKVKKWIWID